LTKKIITITNAAAEIQISRNNDQEN
jgi:hypothetical protein